MVAAIPCCHLLPSQEPKSVDLLRRCFLHSSATSQITDFSAFERVWLRCCCRILPCTRFRSGGAPGTQGRWRVGLSTPHCITCERVSTPIKTYTLFTFAWDRFVQASSIISANIYVKSDAPQCTYSLTALLIVVGSHIDSITFINYAQTARETESSSTLR